MTIKYYNKIKKKKTEKHLVRDVHDAHNNNIIYVRLIIYIQMIHQALSSPLFYIIMNLFKFLNFLVLLEECTEVIQTSVFQM